MVISTSRPRRLRRLRGALAGIALAVAAQAEAAPVSLPGSLPNMVGLGVGSTTEFAGGKDRMIGVVPGVRYVTPGGRLLEWYGPYAQFNFGELTGFQWGPAVGLRLGRNNVDDPVVAQLHEIDTTVEAGGYIGYEYLNSGRVPWRLRGGINVMTNGGIVYGGSRVTATGTFWMPLHRRVYAGMGLGATWVSGSFNRTYFGVDAGRLGGQRPARLQPRRRAGAVYGLAGDDLPVRQALVWRRHDLRTAADRRRGRQSHRHATRHAQPGHLWHRTGLCMALARTGARLAMMQPWPTS